VGPLDKEEPVKAKVSAKAAAIDALRKARKPLPASEIVEGVMKTPGVKLSGDVSSASANSISARERRDPRARLEAQNGRTNAW
jgi:hypothetical protein